MKKETPFWIRCLDLMTILSFGLVAVLRGFDIDSMIYRKRKRANRIRFALGVF